jgi:predicted SprT family Zn-dependent metalloprotease
MSKSFTTLADTDQEWYNLMRRNSEIPQKTTLFTKEEEEVMTIKKYSSCPCRLDAMDITYHDGLPVGIQEVKPESLDKRRVKSCEIQ